MSTHSIEWLRRQFSAARPAAPMIYCDDEQLPGTDQQRPASVLVPVIARDEPTVLFTVRASHLRSGSGQISFPGGRAEPADPTPEHTALRETFDLDISGRRPRHLDTLARRRFTHVITVCDRVREVCPEFAHSPRRAHWSTADPAGSEVGYAAFRRTALDLDSRIRHLLPVLTATDSSEVQP